MWPIPREVAVRDVRRVALLLLVLPWLAGASLAAPAPPVIQTRLALDHLGQAAIDWQNTFG